MQFLLTAFIIFLMKPKMFLYLFCITSRYKKVVNESVEMGAVCLNTGFQVPSVYATMSGIQHNNNNKKYTFLALSVT